MNYHVSHFPRTLSTRTFPFDIIKRGGLVQTSYCLSAHPVHTIEGEVLCSEMAFSSSALITGLLRSQLPLELVGCKLALDAVKSGGAVAAGPAIVALFQVCSTWQRASLSELLWEDLVRHVWDMPQEAQRRAQTWRNEYIRRHLTASNFINNRAEHSWIYQRNPNPLADDREHADFSCLSLTLSPEYLPAGCSDRAVRIYSLTNKQCLDVLRPPRGEVSIILGYSKVIRNPHGIDSIVGIVIDADKVVFASQKGHVFVGGVLQGPVRQTQRARVNVANDLIDGNLMDFIGSNKFWVGLYNLRHACNIWDAVTEQLLINVTDISNPERMRGWHLLTQQARRINRVHVNRNGILAVFRWGDYGVWFRQEKRLEASTNDGYFLTASEDRSTIIRYVTDVEGEDSWPISFATVADDSDNYIPGALNSRQAFLCINGKVRAWNARSGNIIEPLYQLNDQMGVAPNILVADDEHVAGFGHDTGIHLWSFRPSSGQAVRPFDLRNIPEAAI